MLRLALIEEGLDPDDLAADFSAWKAFGPDGEHSSYYFGKDGYYSCPTRHGKMVLRHTHLPPEADAEAAQRWEKAWWQRGSRKTSDTALIYAEDATHGYLLIYIAREPAGHALARMDTPETRQFMNELADVAEAFIQSGHIVI